MPPNMPPLKLPTYPVEDVYILSLYIYMKKSVTEACFYFCKSILFLQVLFIFAPFLLVMWLVSQISEPAHPAPTSVSLQVTRP